MSKRIDLDFIESKVHEVADFIGQEEVEGDREREQNQVTADAVRAFGLLAVDVARSLRKIAKRAWDGEK